MIPAALDAAGRAALAAAHAGDAVERHAGLWLHHQPRRILAIGKAAAAMAAAALRLGGPAPCLVVTKHGHGADCPNATIVEAGHPVPDAAGLAAAAAVERFVDAGPHDALLLVLLSGGTSALLPAPRPPLTLDDLACTTRLLLASGCDIRALNTVRRHLDRLKGGQLARRAAPAPVLTLAVSDVVGDDPATIGSGPTVPDPTTWADVAAAVAAAGVATALPLAVQRLIARGCAGDEPDTPAHGNWPWHAIAGNAQACAAAALRLQADGWSVQVDRQPLIGEAAEAGRRLATRLAALPPRHALVAGGETTVTLGPDPGLGGRNQELALAAAAVLAGTPTALLALATDGSDGPTDAAGAWVDGRTWGEGAAEALANHDAYPWLDRHGRLLRTGPTGTNVCDVVVGLRLT